MLAGRLFYLQVLNGSSYKAEVKRSDTTIQTNNVQRGMIYDSRGKVIVGNQTHQAITYTKSSDVTTAQLYQIANRLGKYITVSNSDTRLTVRNEEDYYLANKDNLKRITKKLNLSKDASDDDQYNAALKYLKSHPNELRLSDHEKSNARIYAAMTGAYSLSTTYIKKSGVTSKELAEVGDEVVPAGDLAV